MFPFWLFSYNWVFYFENRADSLCCLCVCVSDIRAALVQTDAGSSLGHSSKKIDQLSMFPQRSRAERRFWDASEMDHGGAGGASNID